MDRRTLSGVGQAGEGCRVAEGVKCRRSAQIGLTHRLDLI
jgi:hypothetical protein